MKVLAVRTAMSGGGTAYDVYWPVEDKPSKPIHGHIYATVCVYKGREYYRTDDAIDPIERWSMDPGCEKHDAGKKLRKAAERLEFRILRRAFPELRKMPKKPFLWSHENHRSRNVWIDVNVTLPV
jgi:hypothetical protein